MQISQDLHTFVGPLPIGVALVPLPQQSDAKCLYPEIPKELVVFGPILMAGELHLIKITIPHAIAGVFHPAPYLNLLREARRRFVRAEEPWIHH
jgi:hypothetical protein